MHRIGAIDIFPGESGNNYTTTIKPDKSPCGKYALMAIDERDQIEVDQTVDMLEKLIYEDRTARSIAESIAARMAWRTARRLGRANEKIAALVAERDDTTRSAAAWMEGEGIAEDALIALIEKEGAKGVLRRILEMGDLVGDGTDVDHGIGRMVPFWRGVSLVGAPEWAANVVKALDGAILDALIERLAPPEREA